MELVRQNGVKLEATSLSLTRRMDLDEAGQFVLSLDTMDSALPWWIGAFLNQMEAAHGESYAQLIPEGKEQTWMNYKWVESRVKPETRRKPETGLKWSHHQAIASLLTERQEIFLAKAEAESLSVSSLKKLIAKEKGKVEESKLIDRECPSCGWKWQEVEK